MYLPATVEEQYESTCVIYKVVTVGTVVTADSLYQQSAIFRIWWAMGQCRVGPCY